MLFGADEFNLETFCTQTAGVLRVVGWVLTIFKVLIPMIIIVYGMLDFGKAVVASKDDEIKNSAKSLGYRIAAGIIIFFIPSLCIWLFGAITDFSDNKDSFNNCEGCLLHPGDSERCSVSESD